MILYKNLEKINKSFYFIHPHILELKNLNNIEEK